jgi:hypothetical protein
MRLTDWRGNEYGVGDRVLYSTHHGNQTEIVEGEVLDIREVEQERYDWATRKRVLHMVTRVKIRGIRGSVSNERLGHPAWPNIENITAVTNG